MLRLPFYLTSVDPGGITGIISLCIDRDDFTVLHQGGHSYDPLYGETPAHILRSLTEYFNDLPRVLLYEEFRLKSQEFIPDPIALNVIGGIESWLSSTIDTSQLPPRKIFGNKASRSRLADLGGKPECPYALIVSREPDQGKHQATDTVLRRLGLFAEGPLTKDINDGFRHAVSWLVDQRYRPVCERAWPKRRQLPSSA